MKRMTLVLKCRLGRHSWYRAGHLSKSSEIIRVYYACDRCGKQEGQRP